MRREGVAAWGVGLFFVLLAWITFRCVWQEGLVFNASDLSIGRLAFKKQALPELLTGQFSANQLMGSSGYSLTLFHLLLALFPLTFFANTIYGFILLLGSFSMVWYLRLWGCGWIASTVGALSGFWFNSVLLAAAGHAYKQEVLAFFVLSLALIEKAVRSECLRVSLGFGLLTGLSVGVMMIAQLMAVEAVPHVGSGLRVQGLTQPPLSKGSHEGAKLVALRDSRSSFLLHLLLVLLFSPSGGGTRARS